MTESKPTRDCTAYLDIETTGLDPRRGGRITVVGISVEDPFENCVFIQLVGGEITAEKILEIFQAVKTVYTYNGARFDLPFIKSVLGIDIVRLCRHVDLMLSCWRRKLFGGLKRVEKTIGIARRLPEMNGAMAVELWKKYVRTGDGEALKYLLEYNREDVENLRALRRKLEGIAREKG